MNSIFPDSPSQSIRNRLKKEREAVKAKNGESTSGVTEENSDEEYEEQESSIRSESSPVKDDSGELECESSPDKMGRFFQSSEGGEMNEASSPIKKNPSMKRKDAGESQEETHSKKAKK
ncbi:hypothetical protein PILCRDRAFT_15783 [Piloderma croceum F 1598]|uniref:Uncharacterized protein n=1 Tax=Piloderma croceum (strain F 1598) TaxID=765440 RepID=A0A0C3EJI3_PILCF|nr:hypothetical protein PILCRDRAFT_15783 [Piloderma croceum F 1598]